MLHFVLSDSLRWGADVREGDGGGSNGVGIDGVQGWWSSAVTAPCPEGNPTTQVRAGILEP